METTSFPMTTITEFSCAPPLLLCRIGIANTVRRPTISAKMDYRHGLFFLGVNEYRNYNFSLTDIVCGLISSAITAIPPVDQFLRVAVYFVCVCCKVLVNWLTDYVGFF